MQTLMLNQLPIPVLLVWGLPEGSMNVAVGLCHLKARVPTFQEMDDYKLQVWKGLPEGQWQLIGKLSELTEEIIATFVEGNPASDTFCFAIEAEGYHLVNPCSHPVDIMPLSSSLYESLSNKWQEAQSKTLPANTLIFKRV